MKCMKCMCCFSKNQKQKRKKKGSKHSCAVHYKYVRIYIKIEGYINIINIIIYY